jgi:hypothetical protein
VKAITGWKSPQVGFVTGPGLWRLALRVRAWATNPHHCGHGANVKLAAPMGAKHPPDGRISVECRQSSQPGKRVVVTEETKSVQRRILELQTEHRDLDEVVNTLSNRIDVDQLLLRRMKKRKLQLKDQIARLKSQLIPDLDA